MAASNLLERERRTPYTPNGFSYLNRPTAEKIFVCPGGRIHYFAGEDYLRNLSDLRESAVELDMSIFGITYWEAMREVMYNMKSKDGISASFYEPDESLRTRLLQDPQRGRERAMSSVFSKLALPLAELFGLKVGFPIETKSGIRLNNPFGGYATQEQWRLNTGLAVRRMVFFTTVALLPGYTEQKIGPVLFQIPCYLYEPDIVGFRGQTGAVGSALEKTNVTKKLLYGADVEWDTDPEMRSLGRYFEERTRHPKGFDRNKLIAIAVYPDGRNGAYEFGRSHGRAGDIDRKLENRGVHADDGDGAYMAEWTIWAKGRQRFQLLSST